MLYLGFWGFIILFCVRGMYSKQWSGPQAVFLGCTEAVLNEDPNLYWQGSWEGVLSDSLKSQETVTVWEVEDRGFWRPDWTLAELQSLSVELWKPSESAWNFSLICLLGLIVFLHPGKALPGYLELGTVSSRQISVKGCFSAQFFVNFFILK